jgi:hypothetical protein
LTIEDKRSLELSHEQGWTHARTLSRSTIFRVADLNGTAPRTNGVFTSIRSYCAVRSSRKSYWLGIRQKDNLSSEPTHNTVAMRISDGPRYLWEFECNCEFIEERVKLVALVSSWKAAAPVSCLIWDFR